MKIMKKLLIMISVMCLSGNVTAGEINGKTFLNMCRSGEQFNTCIITFGAMKHGFTYGFVAYPTLVLNIATKTELNTFYCRKTAEQVQNRQEYQDFLQVLSQVDDVVLNRDLGMLYVQFLQHQYPIDKCAS